MVPISTNKARHLRLVTYPINVNRLNRKLMKALTLSLCSKGIIF
jgi:hypothetical protein